jgi:protein-L-isoaspartate(D-aspartate) O-methyltransferase
MSSIQSSTVPAPDIRPALIDQLRPGRRMVIPVGHSHGTQEQVLLKKRPDGAVSRRTAFLVAFVP